MQSHSGTETFKVSVIWREQGWWTDTEMLPLQETLHGTNKLIMKQMNQWKRQLCPSQHQQLPHITVFYCSTDPNRLHKPGPSPSFLTHSFLSALGKELPWVSVSCTVASSSVSAEKPGSVDTVYTIWYGFWIWTFHFASKDFASVCSGQGQDYYLQLKLYISINIFSLQ